MLRAVYRIYYLHEEYPYRCYTNGDTHWFPYIHKHTLTHTHKH